ncbi:phage holin [Mycobacterium malmoense]|uniref:phage holin n=1 Tax=Mycobacterium malmoense TaxID=1780 RepID=UPI0008F934EE|nr:hypothetical protein [Mycobacterium malmoense]OIN79784.1 hypothetical protein BMG05_16695 [Mycobacterium malmoense]
MQLLSDVKAFFSTPLFNNIRAVLYVAVPAVLLELAKQGHLSQNDALLWTAVAVAAAGPALASVFAPAGFKTYIAGLLVPVQALLVGIGGAHNLWLPLGAAVVGSIISSGIWAANVHTSAEAA